MLLLNYGNMTTHNQTNRIGIPQVVVSDWGATEPMIQFTDKRFRDVPLRRTRFEIIMEKPREQWLREEWPHDVRNPNP